MENESSKSLLHGRNFPASFHNETTTEIKVGNRTVHLIERIDKVFHVYWLVLDVILYLYLHCIDMNRTALCSCLCRLIFLVSICNLLLVFLQETDNKTGKTHFSRTLIQDTERWNEVDHVSLYFIYILNITLSYSLIINHFKKVTI